MDRMLYVAMNTAKQAFNAQAIASNNLANVATTGFRADLQATRALEIDGPGYPTRVFALLEIPGASLAPGPIDITGEELDVAIDGQGWIAVLAADGSEAYTRAGNLRVNSNGLLETAGGNLVLGNGGLIAVPQSESITIGTDGTISIRPVGQDASTLATVDRIKLVNPPADQLIKGPDSLFRLSDGGEAAADAAVRVIQGALEGSNVNPVSEMINVIGLARRYEMAIRAMDVARENDQLSAQRMRLNA